MMVQNEHWKGQPRPASKLVVPPTVRCTRSAAISGIGAPSNRRQVGHEIVERLEAVRGGILEHLVEPAFGLAGEQRDTHGLCAAQDRDRRRRAC